MKINEAEQILGISKANIRFYEKEGLPYSFRCTFTAESVPRQQISL